MSDTKVLFLEEVIANAVKQLLTGRVNEILGEAELSVPIIEYGGNGHSTSITPIVTHNSCERTEKERLIKIDAYSLTITFEIPETPESELYCYAYSGAVSRAFYDNPTLGGIADRAVVTGKKYIPPKNSFCGEGWGLVVTLRVTIEGMG